MARIRRDIASLGAGWNDTLLWYARAVRELDSLPLSNRTSWRFLGAMHGFDEQMWRDAGLIRPGESVPADLVNDTFGDQCQHGSWYFLPWHRGYLAAFEAIVAASIKRLGGPDDWALPYWNYLNNTPGARNFPQPFLDPRLPDGSPNPLSKPPRENTTVLQPPFPIIPDIDLKSMAEPDFLIGADGSIGFGGGVTTFSRSGNRAGDLEQNPHNPVHVMIGGFGGGFMSDPNFAGLDPIFWIHHCNIDRLWEAWMNAPGRTMVRDPRWLNGPADRRFVMPGADSASQPVRFTARDTLKNGFLHPTYDDIFAGSGVTPAVAGPAVVNMGTTRTQNVDVLGASDSAVQVRGVLAKARVRLDPGPAVDAVRSMGPIEVGKQVVRLYLQLENVTGTSPSAVIDVYVNLPDEIRPDDGGEYRAQTLYLFGLNKASKVDGPHGGNGLGFTIDITELAGRLNQADRFNPGNVDISIVPRGGASEDKPVTVGRVSVLRRKVTANE